MVWDSSIKIAYGVLNQITTFGCFWLRLISHSRTQGFTKIVYIYGKTGDTQSALPEFYDSMCPENRTRSNHVCPDKREPCKTIAKHAYFVTLLGINIH